MTAPIDTEARPIHDEFARRLCAAYLSVQLGISLTQARKRYVSDDEPIGAYWLSLAEYIHGSVGR